MTDPISGVSRGYGFVRFANERKQQMAFSQMQRVYCGNRPTRISTATPRTKSSGGGLTGMPIQGALRQTGYAQAPQYQQQHPTQDHFESKFETERRLREQGAYHQQRLDELATPTPSSINYGGVYTVETNAKVKDFGELDTSYRKALRVSRNPLRRPSQKRKSTKPV
jgi:RNA recognition motif-containing protein